MEIGMIRFFQFKSVVNLFNFLLLICMLIYLFIILVLMFLQNLMEGLFYLSIFYLSCFFFKVMIFLVNLISSFLLYFFLCLFCLMQRFLRQMLGWVCQVLQLQKYSVILVGMFWGFRRIRQWVGLFEDVDLVLLVVGMVDVDEEGVKVMVYSSFFLVVLMLLSLCL